MIYHWFYTWKWHDQLFLTNFLSNHEKYGQLHKILIQIHAKLLSLSEYFFIYVVKWKPAASLRNSNIESNLPWSY